MPDTAEMAVRDIIAAAVAEAHSRTNNMVETPQISGGSPWWGVAIGSVVGIITAWAAALRVFTTRSKDKQTNIASLAQIHSEALIKLLADYQQQVAALRAEVLTLRGEIATVTARYELELGMSDKRYADQTDKYEELLVEVTRLRASVQGD